MTTQVYLLECGEFIKIGISQNIASRISGLQVGNPWPIKYVDGFEFSHSQQARIVEKQTHMILRDRRASGEWFLISNPTERKLVEIWLEWCQRVEKAHKIYQQPLLIKDAAAWLRDGLLEYTPPALVSELDYLANEQMSLSL